MDGTGAEIFRENIFCEQLFRGQPFVGPYTITLPASSEGYFPHDRNRFLHFVGMNFQFHELFLCNIVLFYLRVLKGYLIPPLQVDGDFIFIVNKNIVYIMFLSKLQHSCIFF